ncbi:SDR family NAD(P)-dependent oxidoreductase [Mesorhizobium humile]|uniref:SDR family oxidoreductase n=1 Tax=Mesorhizobium humile TaxID=3072313 RepID=A0ABU4YNK1_9HYPH|nr:MULTISPECIES: SDR family oxidoreductase [unclassified Mesorhizobium]MDX8463174.1 SDR family oxidoreductase [Mesorhizobium sp. VK2D]MDX8488547.1 SDR family oxidoreductase [Mesorhizobium sp. VK2B]
MAQVLNGKVAVITGGARGVGFGIATTFIREGAVVVITGREDDDLQSACAKLGENAFGTVADAGSPSGMDRLLKDVKARHGRLDILVANAVVGEHAPLGAITEDQVDKMIDVNFKGIVFAIQSAVPLMTETGSVIMIGSTASVEPPAGMGVYGGLKAALRGCMRAWIKDVKGTGIRINLLSPGAVDTPSLRSASAKAGGEGKVEAIIQSIRDRHPSGRIGEPDEIGKAAVFLASEASSYVNGLEMFVDGGLTTV